MEIDDNYIFSEYHNSRKEGMPFEYFYNQHHISISKKKFWIQYDRWRKNNQLPLIIPKSIEYLDWLLNNTITTNEQKEKSRNLCLIIQDYRMNFTELVIASSIYILVKGGAKEIMRISGLSQDPISRCKGRISEILSERENNQKSIVVDVDGKSSEI